MGLIGGGTDISVSPPNNPPEWTGTPTPSFQAGVGGTEDLTQYTFDPEGDTLIYSVGSAVALPGGITLSSGGTLTATSAVTQAITSGVVINVKDASNASVESPAFNITVFSASAPPSGNVRNWNPGHYLKTQGNFASNDQASYISAVQSKIDQRIEDSSLILGSMIVIAWGAFNTTGSTYDWDDIDSLIAQSAAKTPPKKLILQLTYKTFRSNQTLIVPADLTGEIETTNSGSIGGLWRSNVMDRYIAALQAFANRYDDNATIEMVKTTESAPSFGGVTIPADYSTGGYSTQLQRMYSEVAPYFTKILFAPEVNFLGNQVPNLIEKQYQERLCTSEPDIDTSTSDEVFRGLSGAVRDYRGTIGRSNIASQPALGGKDDRGPPSNIIDLAQIIGTTHLAWVSDEPSPNSWSDILSAINADPDLATAYPSRYP